MGDTEIQIPAAALPHIWLVPQVYILGRPFYLNLENVLGICITHIMWLSDLPSSSESLLRIWCVLILHHLYSCDSPPAAANTQPLIWPMCRADTGNLSCMFIIREHLQPKGIMIAHLSNWYLCYFLMYSLTWQICCRHLHKSMNIVQKQPDSDVWNWFKMSATNLPHVNISPTIC